MRNLFTTLKSVVALAIVASMTLAASCSYDDTAIKNRVTKVEKDLTALTERVTALEQNINAEIPTLEDLLAGKLVITEVTTDADGNTVLKLSDGSTVTVLADNETEPLQYRVNADGVLEVSADGENWIALSVAPECVIAEAAVNEDGTVTIKLADGSEFTIAKADVVEFNTTRGQLYVKPGQTKEIIFTINDAVADVNVMNQPLGWKAEVALAAADENEGGDDVDPGTGILAAGGTEFALKITAPSQKLLDEAIAETKGYITVHFNSEGGACKVGKIAVEVAYITLDVDKAGNITVESTWVDEYLYSSWMGEELVQEFNNYYMAIMPIEYYVEDLASIYNASWWEFNVPCVGGWINNFFYNVNEEYNTQDKVQYQEGVNEKWIFKATVEEVLGQLDWSGEFTYEGNSFMVIVIPTDPQTYGSLMIDQAIAVPFKQLNVNVEVIETTWNKAYLNATLRGANAYQFNIENKDELMRQIENGWYDSLEGFYTDYIYYWQNYGSSFGSHRITSDVVAENIEFNELINTGEEYPYLYELAPNTTYIVGLLAEEDGKTEYAYEDIKIIEFTTKDVTPAAEAFEYTITRDDEQTDYFRIFANVTVPETAVAVYSRWYDELPVTDEDIKADLITYGWVKNNFSEGYTYELNTTVNAAGDEKILGIMIVDAEGNYSIGQQTLSSQKVVVNENVTLTIQNVEFLTEPNGGVANITLGGLEGVEFTKIQAYVCATDGNSYYIRSEEQLQDIAYGTDYLYVQYDTNPFKVTRTGDYKYQATEGKTYIVAVAAQLADGTVTNVVYEEIEFAAPKAEPIVFTSAAAEDAYSQYYGDYKKLTLSNDTMTVVFGVRNGGYSYLPETTYGNYWDDTSAVYSLMDTYTCWTWDDVFTANNAVPTMVVSLNEEGKYKLDITVEYYDGSVAAVEAVFEGDIEGIGYENGGDDTIETIELTSAVATSAGSSNIGGTGYNLTFSDGNGTEIVYMVQTLGNTYLKEGEWNGNYSWNEEGYINSATWTNVNTAWPYSMTVAVVDGAYDINLEVVDYYGAGQPTLTAHYAGQIEGFTLPGAGGENEEIVTENLTFELSTIDGYTSTAAAAYCDIRLVDTNGKNYVQIEANDPSLYTHSYTIDNITHYNNGTLYYSNTYVVYSGNPTEENVKMNSGTIDVTVDGDNCTIVIDAVLADGKAFSGTYTGAKPF